MSFGENISLILYDLHTTVEFFYFLEIKKIYFNYPFFVFKKNRFFMQSLQRIYLLRVIRSHSLLRNDLASRVLAIICSFNISKEQWGLNQIPLDVPPPFIRSAYLYSRTWVLFFFSGNLKSLIFVMWL